MIGLVRIRFAWASQDLGSKMKSANPFAKILHEGVLARGHGFVELCRHWNRKTHGMRAYQPAILQEIPGSEFPSIGIFLRARALL